MPARLGITFAALAVLILSGCGSSASPKDAVRAKVQQFATATAQHDYTTICSQALAPDLVAHLQATGVTCEQAWQVGLGSVRNPTLSIGQVTVKGSKDTAIVLSLAVGQPSALDAIELVKTGDGWRIESLSPYDGTTPSG